MEATSGSAQVGCTLEFDIRSPSELVLQVAAATRGPSTLSTSPYVEVVELPGPQHYLRAPAGKLVVTYSASVDMSSFSPPEVPLTARIEALRPSRYCPSDRLAGFAGRQFGIGGDPAETVRAITNWVHDHLIYQGGSSGPSTDAIDTLVSGAGVCRDYAHLVVTLCRALDIPARVAAVYAPGLFPMDFHLVAETALDGQWRVWDATRLAPRQSLIRIATGRDAADTALATTISGALTMPATSIFAVAPGDLPVDDHHALVSLGG